MWNQVFILLYIKRPKLVPRYVEQIQIFALEEKTNAQRFSVLIPDIWRTLQAEDSVSSEIEKQDMLFSVIFQSWYNYKKMEKKIKKKYIVWYENGTGMVIILAASLSWISFDPSKD